MRIRTGLATLLAPILLIAQPQVHVAESDPRGFVADVLMTGMRQPAAMVFLPDRRAIIIERRTALIHLIDLTTGRATPVAGGPQAFTGDDRPLSDPRRPATLTGEDSGLHDIVLHPRYSENGWIYISYSSGTLERSTTVIDRYRLRGHELVDRERVFTADAYSEDRFHYGGRMAFSEGYLFVTIGDRHHEDRAQDLSNHAGKLLRLHDDGRVPADNPFAGRKDAKEEIWSYGHRNAQGLVVHPDTGELWLHEHGPLGGDELNLVRRGANYGWPVISYGWRYAGGPIGQGLTAREGMEQPVWVWTPAIAPSGLIVYTGDQFPSWRGSFFSGAMSKRHLNRLVLRDGRVVVEERLMSNFAGRVRLVAQGPDGFIYIANDGGELLRLRRGMERR
ncbi:MAG TPA: PQQ-dependent sugar dehydrogenase [Thermoanaerobaculia bacterium]|nr:PQQ-dependent sugar dehydrogenase [Thermoanaerobaculia bacterium]